MPRRFDAKRSGEGFGKAIAAAFLTFAIIKLLSLLLLAVIATLWFTERTRTAAARTAGNFGKDLLTGFIIMIAAPIALAILFATVIGILPAFILMTALALAAMLAAILAPIVFGALVRKWLGKHETLPVDWKSAVLGVVLLGILALVPFVGWLTVAVFFLASFGSIARLVNGGFIAKR